MSAKSKALLTLAGKGAASRVLRGGARRRLLSTLRTRLLKLGLRPKNLEIVLGKRGGGLLRMSPGSVGRLYADSAAFQRLLIYRVRGAAQTILRDFGEKEWLEILNKAKAALLAQPQKLGGHFARVKGIILELAIRLDVRFAKTEARLSEKIAVLGQTDTQLAQVKWGKKARGLVGCTTPTPTGIGEVADAVFATFGADAQKKSHVWIMGMLDSKSEENAIELINKGQKRFRKEGKVIEKEGEFLGQLEMNIERIKEFGITIPGHGYFPPERVHVRWPNVGIGAADPRQVTELIGVVPPDTPIDVMKQLRNGCRKKGIDLWTNSLSGEVAGRAAAEVIGALTR